MQPSDQTLISQICVQDAAAFEAFFARYLAAMQRHMLNIVRDEAATEDLVQELFLRVWTRAEQWDGRGPVKAWLYRMAGNLALNHLRTLRRHPQEPLPTTPKALPKEDWNDDDEFAIPAWMIDDAAIRPDAFLVEAERRRRFWQMVDTLPAEKRDVLQLVYNAEMDLHSVAKELGIPEGTVKSRLHHSKRQLAERWGPHDAEW
ncbi:MAG: RNA polymerase sigma factor [Caldilineaceae bacterium]